MTSKALITSSLALAALAALVAAPRAADAVGTRSFDLRSLDDFLGGDLRGVAVDSRGQVRAGWNLTSLALHDANSVWSSLVLADGAVLLGTGQTGKVLKVAGGRASVFAETGQLAVTSLATGPGGAVFAATLPAGKIFRIDAGGKATELPHIADADNIWALAFDAKKNTLYAATGPHGKLFALPGGGAAQVYFDSDEANLVSLAVGDDGAVYAGSSGKALVFKLTGPGRATVAYDCAGDEVKALAVRAGVVYAACNDFGGEAPEPPRRPANAPVTAAGPAATGSRKAGKGALYRVDAAGRSERILFNSETHFISLALDENGRPYVGTGADGRVYSVDENRTVTLFADTDQRQVGTLVVAGKTRFLATSDPAVFHEIRGTGGADATWTSRVLDAGLRASFGRLFWRADGAVEMSTRTGNSLVPDATWSDWSHPITAPNKTGSPAGRFVQVRARFAREPNAVLREAQLSFVTDNMRAVVTSIDLAAKPPAGAQGATTPKDLPASGAEPPTHSPNVKISWHVDNPDNDALRYRVFFRLDSQTTFREITKPDEVFTKTEIEWDTQSLAEGTYRVRVEASDELSNPPDRVARHFLDSGTMVVDNTPPVFRALTAQGRRVRAEIVDGVGPIARVDYAVDGRAEWRPLSPKDGVFDEPVEQIDVDLGAFLSPGPHLIAVRAFDQAGNYVVRDVEMR